ncbi:toll/interleukin-1 receptor domain-containing protein [Mucilaginibacter flavus]|uniref:toll/interleukin-1 receptor domain-containing protein n=1 Tax=Mucilaginibacter flavus TaxID=931504 RepID=UPI0025B3C40C|nr:toll/interleukin-1 receptor domain-containing protein [Mucilaginibacter flavus]MDN3582494.1 toll/interleukin-1 receptor domain-containing protein [Mucilaginibacter flavus]
MIFPKGYFNNQAVNENFVTRSLNEVRTFSALSASKAKPTVFLSHKHDDLSDLRGLMGLLEGIGAKIYIDSMDNKMPDQTCGDSAARIKEVIKFCDKFVLLATAKAIESYWCNWELGIGDTHKFIQHIAILPIKDSGQYDWQYKGNEYLQIYPQIDYEDGSRFYQDGTRVAAGYYVSRPANKQNVNIITPLKQWLATR